ANAGSIEDYISDAIRDLNERGVLPKNIYTDEKGQPLVMWHATTHGTDIAGSTFHRWSHFGTLQAAVDRINLREALQQKHLTKIDRHQIRDANKPTNIAIPDRIDTNVFHRGKTITFFPVYFKARKFLRTVDDGAQHPSGIALRHVK